jgi:ankyrin repeat protein
MVRETTINMLGCEFEKDEMRRQYYILEAATKSLIHFLKVADQINIVAPTVGILVWSFKKRNIRSGIPIPEKVTSLILKKINPLFATMLQDIMSLSAHPPQKNTIEERLTHLENQEYLMAKEKCCIFGFDGVFTQWPTKGFFRFKQEGTDSYIKQNLRKPTILKALLDSLYYKNYQLFLVVEISPDSPKDGLQGLNLIERYLDKTLGSTRAYLKKETIFVYSQENQSTQLDKVLQNIQSTFMLQADLGSLPKNKDDIMLVLSEQAIPQIGDFIYEVCPVSLTSNHHLEFLRHQVNVHCQFNNLNFDYVATINQRSGELKSNTRAITDTEIKIKQMVDTTLEIRLKAELLGRQILLYQQLLDTPEAHRKSIDLDKEYKKLLDETRKDFEQATKGLIAERKANVKYAEDAAKFFQESMYIIAKLLEEQKNCPIHNLETKKLREEKQKLESNLDLLYQQIIGLQTERQAQGERLSPLYQTHKLRQQEQQQLQELKQKDQWLHGGSDLSKACASGDKKKFQRTIAESLNLLETIFAGRKRLINTLDPKLGTAPLHLACLWGHEDLVHHLLEQEQAEIELLTKDQGTENGGYTALHLAVLAKQESIVALLLRKGANVNAQGLYQRTPLIVAIYFGSTLAIIEQLLANGAELDLTQQNTQQNPLHLAASQGNADEVALFLDHGGIDLRQPDLNGNTAILCAIDRYHVAAVTQFLDRGYQLNQGEQALLRKRSNDPSKTKTMMSVLQQVESLRTKALTANPRIHTLLNTKTQMSSLPKCAILPFDDFFCRAPTHGRAGYAIELQDSYIEKNLKEPQRSKALLDCLHDQGYHLYVMVGYSDLLFEEKKTRVLVERYLTMLLGQFRSYLLEESVYLFDSDKKEKGYSDMIKKIVQDFNQMIPTSKPIAWKKEELSERLLLLLPASQDPNDPRFNGAPSITVHTSEEYSSLHLVELHGRIIAKSHYYNFNQIMIDKFTRISQKHKTRIQQSLQFSEEKIHKLEQNLLETEIKLQVLEVRESLANTYFHKSMQDCKLTQFYLDYQTALAEKQKEFVADYREKLKPGSTDKMLQKMARCWQDQAQWEIPFQPFTAATLNRLIALLKDQTNQLLTERIALHQDIERRQTHQQPFYDFSQMWRTEQAQLQQGDNWQPAEVNPVSLACQKGDLQQFSELKQLAVSSKQQTQKEFINKIDPLLGMAPLHLASQYGHSELITYILNREGDIELKNSDQRTKDGYMALHIAAQYNQVAVMAQLLNSGANVNAKGRYQRTPLHYAIKYGSTLEVIQCLLDKGADVNLQQEDTEETALHLAAADMSGDPELVGYLLDHTKVDLRARDANQDTPLMSAIKRNHKAVVRQFYDRGYGLSLSEYDQLLLQLRTPKLISDVMAKNISIILQEIFCETVLLAPPRQNEKPTSPAIQPSANLPIEPIKPALAVPASLSEGSPSKQSSIPQANAKALQIVPDLWYDSYDMTAVTLAKLHTHSLHFAKINNRDTRWLTTGNLIFHTEKNEPCYLMLFDPVGTFRDLNNLWSMFSKLSLDKQEISAEEELVAAILQKMNYKELKSLAEMDERKLGMELSQIDENAELISLVLSKLKISDTLEEFHHKLRVNPTQQNTCDIFDEIAALETVVGQGDKHIRILCNFNPSGSHWMTLELTLTKQNNTWQLAIYQHDPCGGGQFPENWALHIKDLIKTRLKIFDRHIVCHACLSPYWAQRQQDRDSCGVIAVEELVMRLCNKNLNSSRTYPSGALNLREQHQQQVQQAFPPGNETLMNFTRRNLPRNQWLKHKQVEAVSWNATMQRASVGKFEMAKVISADEPNNWGELKTPDIANHLFRFFDEVLRKKMACVSKGCEKKIQLLKEEELTSLSIST